VGEAREAVMLSRRLEEQGLLIPAIRPPSVPKGSARLRLSVTAAHTEEDVMRIVEAWTMVRRADKMSGRVFP
jgi:8-amino-7-oxononanoate synthase